METVFKKDDKVFHINYGWGCVTELTDYTIMVDFNGEKLLGFSDDKLFSFTEYTLQGFSQERPIILPEVGELCLMRDDYDEGWRAVFFKEYNPESKNVFPYVSTNGLHYKKMKRIKILD
jgi:hypothetical protein